MKSAGFPSSDGDDAASTADAPDSMPTSAPAPEPAAKRAFWDESDAPPEESPSAGTREFAFPRVAPWLVSSVVHAALLILLALLAIQTPGGESLSPDLTATSDNGTDGLDMSDLLLNAPSVEPPDIGASTTELVERVIDSPPVDLSIQSAVEIPLNVSSGIEFSPSDLSDSVPLGLGPAIGGGLQGRTASARAALVRQRGGAAQSEAAVEAGLAWLARHQMPDGSWRFPLSDVPGCTCRNPGLHQSTTAATGLALLPFLGAGYTHLDGKYQEVVNKGIYYLANHVATTPGGGDVRESSDGSMYEQGIATLALCEAYAMTRDRSLAPVAQQTVDFIVYAQHEGGGWRYQPQTPGDTTVTGWQVMALKSAYLGRLNVRREVWYKVHEFLDGVQMEDGALYGYTSPRLVDPEDSNSAIGLLARMLLGWEHDRRALAVGVAYLDAKGPSPNNLYYNYYATQVMHHYEGRMWDRWNAQMRDPLVATQVKSGHEAGSWHFDQQYARTGGRLYNTALAIMILEVYYRHLPIYSGDALILP